jgi:hypothetical protein
VLTAFKITVSPGSTWSDLPSPDGTVMFFKIVSTNHPPWMD